MGQIINTNTTAVLSIISVLAYLLFADLFRAVIAPYGTQTRIAALVGLVGLLLVLLTRDNDGNGNGGGR